MHMSASVRLIRHCINLLWVYCRENFLPSRSRIWLWIVGRAYSKYIDETTSFFCIVLWKCTRRRSRIEFHPNREWNPIQALVPRGSVASSRAPVFLFAIATEYSAPVRHCHAHVTFVIFLSQSPPTGEGLPPQGLALVNRQLLATITTKRLEGFEGL